MPNSFIEQNKPLLKFYCGAARLTGWILISTSSLVIGGNLVALSSRLSDWEAFKDYLPYFPLEVCFHILPTGLLALGVAQFIKYVFDKEYQPHWILRNAHTILYLYAALTITYSIAPLLLGVNYNTTFPVHVYLFLFLNIATKVLIFVGLAQILRRVMPVIEESRTLV